MLLLFLNALVFDVDYLLMNAPALELEVAVLKLSLLRRPVCQLLEAIGCVLVPVRLFPLFWRHSTG